MDQVIEYNRPKLWSGKDLTGTWEVTLKLDGVRVLSVDGENFSRAGKPLYNLPIMMDGDYECFIDNWETTVSRVRKHEGEQVRMDDLYSLDPLDPRLRLTTLEDPSKDTITDIMNHQVSKGHEGLILRQGDRWLKVKPRENVDLLVTGYQPGTGKHKGRMGALITELCKVGTGFTDELRDQFSSDFIIGKIIEVSYMNKTPAGKLRHPAFVRLREDKCICHETAR